MTRNLISDVKRQRLRDLAWPSYLDLSLTFMEGVQDVHATNFVYWERSLSLPDVLDSNDNPLQTVKDVTILGVRFCHDMKWNLHVGHIVSKASKRIFLCITLSGLAACLIFFIVLMWRISGLPVFY